MIVRSAGDDVAAFRRDVIAGKLAWPGLALPWDADLRGLHLAGADLSGATLRGARLDGVALSGCKLVEADLRNAQLPGALLVRADLRGANLRAANLRGADLTKADLCEADLVAADLRGALCEGMAVSFACNAWAGVALSGQTVRLLYSLLLSTRCDDPAVASALASLRPLLEVPASERVTLDEGTVAAAAASAADEGPHG